MANLSYFVRKSAKPWNDESPILLTEDSISPNRSLRSRGTAYLPAVFESHLGGGHDQVAHWGDSERGDGLRVPPEVPSELILMNV